MKKKKFFLIILLSIMITNFLVIKVNAESASFYEGEYINNIYMNKFRYATNTLYFQKARFFRNSNTNEFAYCIEPFQFFEESGTYESTINPNNLSPEQRDRIGKIAHFGYGYKNHTDIKWYPITQLMIWQAADPTGGDYYFTDKLNGNRLNTYQNEINEINYLVDSYSKTPSFSNQTFDIVENHSLQLEDTNNILQDYKTDNSKIKIENNKLSIENLKEGNYTISLYKEDQFYNRPLIFYQSANSQNLVETGDIDKIEVKIKINVFKTFLEIIKIDKDTKSITPSGEGKLDGAIYTLYDKDMHKIQDLTIKNNEATLENLNFGKYFLKESKSGEGYTTDEKTYEINISQKNTKIELVLENKIIEKKFIIEKKYGENNNYKNEKNITFNIFNNKNELIKTVTTNEEGIAEFILPYGNYQLIQVNTTEGYNKIEPKTLQVFDSSEELIELKDLKIPVPNTSTNKTNIIICLILQLLIILL